MQLFWIGKRSELNKKKQIEFLSVFALIWLNSIYSKKKKKKKRNYNKLFNKLPS